MTDWQMWAILSSMLYVGSWCRVGVFLHGFAAAAAVTAGLTLLSWLGLSLHGQLQSFLLLSLLFPRLRIIRILGRGSYS